MLEKEVLLVNEEALARGRKLYVVQAAVEYLVAILVSGSFLATITMELGFSDSLTGIVSAIISLGCLFQLLSVAIRRNVKHTVVFLSLANQVLFLLLYVIPLSGSGKPFKTVAFVVAIVLAYFIYYIIHPKKFNWLMSTVEDGHRGTFTATKEIVSLVTGMAFSFGMGAVVDYLAARGEQRMAFVVCAAVIFLLSVAHMALLWFVPASECENKDRSLMSSVKLLLHNKGLRKTVVVFALYYIANYAITPFLGVYKISELDMSLSMVTAVTMVGSGTRIAVSHMWGRYADRRSFAAMAEKCFLFFAAAQVCVVFSNPTNGVVMMILYYAFHGVAMGGINSSLTNMVYDYVPRDQCSNAIAVTQAMAGVVGFLTTLCVSPLVAKIQAAGNTVLGMSVYAQQVLAVGACIVTVAIVIYVRLTLVRKKGD